MPAVVTVVIHGPSLEQLASWGNLDTLPWSLDHELWAEASFMRLGITEQAFSGASCSPVLCRKGYGAAQARSASLCRSGVRSERAGATGVVSGAECQGIVFSTHLEALARSEASCPSGLLLLGWGTCEAETRSRCTGELRGHGWIQVPETDSPWKERML